jgi:hypothetical protein
MRISRRVALPLFAVVSMGIFSSLNPVRAVRKVADAVNPVRLVNNTYRSFEEFTDDQLGIGRNSQERQRGLFDPLGSKQAKDDAAREAETNRAFEEKRQADIRTGTQRVNDTFSQFADPFYEAISKAFEDYYIPQLDEQYGRAKRSLVLSSPSTGSSAFARRIGELTRDRQRHQVAIRERGQGAANSQRQNIENSRLSLIDSVNRGLGIDEAGNMAADRYRLLRAPAPYDPLPDLFERAVAGYANVKTAQQAGFSPDDPLLFSSRGSNTRTVS